MQRSLLIYVAETRFLIPVNFRLITRLGHLNFSDVLELLLIRYIWVLLENRIGALQVVSVSHWLLFVEKDEAVVFDSMDRAKHSLALHLTIRAIFTL